MKHLPLRTLIPITAATALVAIGCGGKAVDESTEGGDGDAVGPGPAPSDPLSDANFPQSFDRAIDDYCVLTVRCGQYTSESACADELSQLFSLAFDLESRDCRGRFLDTFDCMEEDWDGCDTYTQACYDLAQEFTEECGNFGDDYDY